MTHRVPPSRCLGVQAAAHTPARIPCRRLADLRGSADQAVDWPQPRQHTQRRHARPAPCLACIMATCASEPILLTYLIKAISCSDLCTRASLRGTPSSRPGSRPECHPCCSKCCPGPCRPKLPCPGSRPHATIPGTHEHTTGERWRPQPAPRDAPDGGEERVLLDDHALAAREAGRTLHLAAAASTQGKADDAQRAGPCLRQIPAPPLAPPDRVDDAHHAGCREWCPPVGVAAAQHVHARRSQLPQGVTDVVTVGDLGAEAAVASAVSPMVQNPVNAGVCRTPPCCPRQHCLVAGEWA